MCFYSFKRKRLTWQGSDSMFHMRRTGRGSDPCECAFDGRSGSAAPLRFAELTDDTSKDILFLR